MLQASYANSFKRDMKRLLKQGKNLLEVSAVIDTLIAEIPLDARYNDHDLFGNWINHRECHIASDWLLIYRYDGEDGIYFVRSGTHSELYKK